MANPERMKRLCDFYIRRVAAIGALYALVPILIWFTGTFVLIPFRPVYVIRLIVSLVIGVPLAAFANRFGLRLWLIKHGSSEGPATVLDGVLIGAASGVATVLVPPVTALISSHHPEEAKTFVIAAWLAGIAIGALLGGILASIGRAHLDRVNSRRGE